jgi:hypothetical protein
LCQRSKVKGQKNIILRKCFIRFDRRVIRVEELESDVSF